VADEWRKWRNLGWRRHREIDGELWRGHTVEQVDYAVVSSRIKRLRTSLLWNRIFIDRGQPLDGEDVVAKSPRLLRDLLAASPRRSDRVRGRIRICLKYLARAA
jgi:hypothetical protein